MPVNRYRCRVNSVAVEPAREAPGNRLLKAGAIAFLAVVASWVIYAVVSGRGGALNEVDLTVYRDGGLIVRHVRPYYDPHTGAPLYDWGGYSSLALKFTYTPFAAITFALISFIPWAAMPALSVIVNIAALVAALWFTFGGLGYTDRRVRLGATLLAAAGAGSSFTRDGAAGASLGMALATAIAMLCYAVNLVILGKQRG